MTNKSAQDNSGRSPRRPAAFILEEDQTRASSAHATPGHEPASVTVSSPPHEDDDIAFEPPVVLSRKSRMNPGKWLAIGLGGLISLAAGLAIDSLIRDLFSRTSWLGWVGVTLAALAVLALLTLLIREFLALRRVARIDELRSAHEQAAESDDPKAAQRALANLCRLYEDRPDTARGRRMLQGHMREIIDGRDLVVLAERDLLTPLDAQARRIVMSSAKRVSVITAISPRALVDLMVVLFENLRVIRQISVLYGGRPGTLGFLRLTRHIATHLALTGGMAAGDSLFSQFLGHGLAARLSARLGEGVVNGLLTARIGIAAISVCRPVPFIATKGPTISDFMGEIVNSEKPEGKESQE